MPSQAALGAVWLQAPEGKLCGREQAKAWAHREMWRADGKGDYGMYTFVASRVKNMYRGQPRGASPSVAAVKEFFAKVDMDQD